MQRSITIAFLSALTLMAYPLSAQDSQVHSKAETTTEATIEGKVFVSCEVQTVGGFLTDSTTFTLKNGEVHLVNKDYIEHKSEEKSVQLTPDEMKRFLRLIEEAHFFALKRSYHDNGIADAGLVTTTLTVRSHGKEQVYSVVVYGRTAPKAFYKFESAVWAFEREKLPMKRP